MVEHLEWDTIPLPRKSLIPGEGFFQVDRDEPVVDEERFDGVEVVVIADPDADGLTSTALVEDVHDDITLVPTEPHRFERTVEQLVNNIEPGMTVYILDLSPDAFEPIESAITSMVDTTAELYWFDHHEWDESTANAVREVGVNLSIGASDEVCTADVTLDELDGDFDDRWVDLVAVVRDHDLWLREDPRSDDVADLAYWSNPAEFIETISEHGADFPADVLEFLDERRVEKQSLIDLAVSRAEFHEIEGFVIGITYGRCSQNEVAETLRQEGADAAAVIKPSGGISLRGTDTFQRCHVVAQRLGGGGHPKAAGCKPAIFDDMLDFAQHWVTQGATSKHLILQAFDAVTEDQPE